MIEYYVGNDGPTIVVEDKQDFIDALDIFHTQALDAEDSDLADMIIMIIDRLGIEQGLCPGR